MNNSRIGHEAMVFDTTEELLGGAVPFIEEGLRAGAIVVTACRPHLARVLSEAVGADGLVSWPHSTVFRDPKTALEAYRQLLSDHRGDQRSICVVAEVDFGHTASWQDWNAFEVAMAEVLQSPFGAALCLYDRSTLAREAIFVGETAHRFVRVDGERRANPTYRPVIANAADGMLDGANVVEALEPALFVPAVEDTRMLRFLVRPVLYADPEAKSPRVENLVLAIHEAVALGLRSPARRFTSLRLWCEEGRVTAKVVDHVRIDGSSHADWADLRPVFQDLVESFETFSGPDGFTILLHGSVR